MGTDDSLSLRSAAYRRSISLSTDRDFSDPRWALLSANVFTSLDETDICRANGSEIPLIIRP